MREILNIEHETSKHRYSNFIHRVVAFISLLALDINRIDITRYQEEATVLGIVLRYKVVRVDFLVYSPLITLQCFGCASKSYARSRTGIASWVLSHVKSCSPQV